MKDSFVINKRNEEKLAKAARGYVRAPSWSDAFVLTETLPRYRYSIYFGDTAGPMGVYSSAEDLFRWVLALNGGKLVKAERLRAAYAPAKLNDGTTPGAGGGAGNDDPSHYGYGWFLQGGSGGKTVRHTGDWRGYVTCLIHNLDKDQTVIVLSNVCDYSAIGVANAIENVLNGKPYTLPKMSIGRVVGKAIFTTGAEAAVRQYRTLKETRPHDYNFESEAELNMLGYELRGRGSKTEAVEVFKLNAEVFPESWNVYDSLAEGCEAAGDKASAVKNFKRSLELNPKNSNATEHLKKLEADGTKKGSGDHRPAHDGGANAIDAAVERVAKKFMENGQSVGLSLGIYKDGKTYTYNFGTTKRGKQLPATTHT